MEGSSFTDGGDRRPVRPGILSLQPDGSMTSSQNETSTRKLDLPGRREVPLVTEGETRDDKNRKDIVLWLSFTGFVILLNNRIH